MIFCVVFCFRLCTDLKYFNLHSLNSTTSTAAYCIFATSTAYTITTTSTTTTVTTTTSTTTDTSIIEPFSISVELI